MTDQVQQPKPPFPPQHLSPPGLESELDPQPRFRAPRYRPAGKLEGLVALVTGGDSGIGRAVATIFAREGADVALVYLPEEQSDAEVVREEIAAEGRRALLLPGDVTDSGFCEHAVERCVTTLGALDVLVNNAAVQKHRDALSDISDQDWDLTFRTNIHGYFYMARAAVERMRRGSVIVNTGSVTGLEGNKRLLDYASTKGAIHAFTKSLAQNLQERGIRVNCVAPGPVWTPLNPAELEPEESVDFGQDVPMGRPAQPEEIAPAYVFFASNADSPYITGAVLGQLGGETSAG